MPLASHHEHVGQDLHGNHLHVSPLQVASQDALLRRRDNAIVLVKVDIAPLLGLTECIICGLLLHIHAQPIHVRMRCFPRKTTTLAVGSDGNNQNIAHMWSRSPPRLNLRLQSGWGQP